MLNKSVKITLSALCLAFFSHNVLAKDLDPLSPAELSKAVSLAAPEQSLQLAQRSATQAPATANELELLLVERRPTDKEQPGKRLADVYSYDYRSDETIHNIVDLNTQALVETERVQKLQLPLTANELARATKLIFNDPEQLTEIQTEYQRITGQTLSNPEQLEVKAFTFTTDSLPEGLNAASQNCGVQRCAQILLYTHDSVVFEISPIVNLSAGLVTQNIGF
jgi:Cu2+-containing amine oxidase